MFGRAALIYLSWKLAGNGVKRPRVRGAGPDRLGDDPTRDLVGSPLEKGHSHCTFWCSPAGPGAP